MTSEAGVITSCWNAATCKCECKCWFIRWTTGVSFLLNVCIQICLTEIHLFSLAQQSRGCTLLPSYLWGTSEGICFLSKLDIPPAQKETERSKTANSHSNMTQHTESSTKHWGYGAAVHLSDLSTGVAVVPSECEAEISCAVHAHHHLWNWNQYRCSFSERHPQFFTGLLGQYWLCFFFYSLYSYLGYWSLSQLLLGKKWSIAGLHTDRQLHSQVAEGHVWPINQRKRFLD